MATIDRTDVEILRLLIEDARRPFSEIAQEVDLSPPTVSDRIERLKKKGVLARMTIELDRDELDGWTPLLVRVTPESADSELVEQQLADLAYTQSVYRTADDIITAELRGPVSSVREALREDIGLAPGEIDDIALLSSKTRTPSIPEELLDEPREEADPAAPVR